MVYRTLSRLAGDFTGESAEAAKANLAEAIELSIETWGTDDLEISVGNPELATVEIAG